MLRLVLVDDEPRARRGLKRMISENADIEIVGEADSIAQARHLIDMLQPDAIFLDVELSDDRGFDLLENLVPAPAIVFVTAHSNYAPKAFEVSAVDYLLKPVEQGRVAQALDRLRRLKRMDEHEIYENRRLHLKMPGRSLVLPADMISLLAAEGDFTRLLTADAQDYFVCRLLGSFEPELPTPPFLRISRSLVVNLDHVESITSGDSGRMVVSFGAKLDPIEIGRIPGRRLLQHFSRN